MQAAFVPHPDSADDTSYFLSRYSQSSLYTMEDHLSDSALDATYSSSNPTLDMNVRIFILPSPNSIPVYLETNSEEYPYFLFLFVICMRDYHVFLCSIIFFIIPNLNLDSKTSIFWCSKAPKIIN